MSTFRSKTTLCQRMPPAMQSMLILSQLYLFITSPVVVRVYFNDVTVSLCMGSVRACDTAGGQMSAITNVLPDYSHQAYVENLSIFQAPYRPRALSRVISQRRPRMRQGYGIRHCLFVCLFVCVSFYVFFYNSKHLKPIFVSFDTDTHCHHYQ